MHVGRATAVIFVYAANREKHDYEFWELVSLVGVILKIPETITALASSKPQSQNT